LACGARCDLRIAHVAGEGNEVMVDDPSGLESVDPIAPVRERLLAPAVYSAQEQTMQEQVAKERAVRVQAASIEREEGRENTLPENVRNCPVLKNCLSHAQQSAIAKLARARRRRAGGTSRVATIPVTARRLAC
jgi:hypothetical protein